MAVDVGSAKGYLDLDISGFLSSLRTAQNEADNASANMATKIGNNISGIGKSLTSAGTTLTKSLTVPLVGAAAAGLKVATDFEKGMSQVKAISGATGKDFDALKEKAIELGADTAFSAGEVADAMTEMAKAGWSSEQIIDGMSGVLAAAAASGEGLASVSTIVADSITGFGLAAADSTKVADLLTQAANSGTIGIADLGETFKYIAPVAGAMGLSIEDVTTAVSAMSMAGIKGSQAGTALRTMLTNMVNPSEDAATVMEKLGISATHSDGSMKSLDEIVKNLRDSFSGLTEAERAEAAAQLAGKTGMSGMLALLNLTEEEYNAIAESMDNAGGVAEKTASIMQDNLQSKVEQLGGALESLAIKLADYVLPYIQQFVVWLTSLIDKFTALDPETQKTILKFGGLVAAAGPLLVVAGKLTTGVGNLVTAFGKAPGAMTKMTNGITTLMSKITGVPAATTAATSGTATFGSALSGLASAAGPILAVVAVIAVLVGAFVSLWKNNEDFRNKITAIWNEIKDTFNAFAKGIVDRINSLGFNFKSITDVIKALWKAFCDFLAPIFEGVFKQISNIFKAVTNTILGIIDYFIAIFKGDWKGAWNAVKSIFESVWNLIKNTFSNILNTLKGLVNTFLGWFGTNWSNVWNNIKTTFVNIWNGIKTSASNIITGIKNTISTQFNSAKTTVSNIFNSIKSSISNALSSAQTTVQNAISRIKSFFNFSWSLPKLKMPHFSITGSFSLNPPSVPKLSISWYKKAMSGGMILNAATIFGMDQNGNLLGAGEAGSETVVGTESLMKMIRQAVTDAIKPVIAATYDLARTSAELGYITHNAFVKQAKAQEENRKYKDGEGNGDTYIFNSPKAIDEIEAARQMKKTKRELAEGF